jgi:hypothetical protein
MANYFWIVQSPKSSVDPTPHLHIIYRLTKPTNLIAGPFPNEARAIIWLNYYNEKH